MGDMFSFPFPPEDLTKSCPGVSFRRNLRGLMDHVVQREKYSNIPHIKMAVFGLSKNHFGQLDGALHELVNSATQAP